MPFTLPDLPYSQDALAPHISAETLSFHYGKHHKNYVNKLNELTANTPLANESLEAVTAATYAAGFDLPSYKSRDEHCAALEELTLFGMRTPAVLKVTAATSEGNNLARWLTALPGNELTPASYRRRVTQLARPMLPYIVALFLGIVVLCAFPTITTIVPDLLLGR